MGCRIVVADDAAFVRRMIVTIVSQDGHEVVAEASDGRQVIAAYFEHRPDVVIMDVLMPPPDGIEAVELIRARDPEAKVIMCSAVAEPTVVARAIAAGALDFVVKPVASERLLQSIRRVWGQSMPRMGGEQTDDAVG